MSMVTQALVVKHLGLRAPVSRVIAELGSIKGMRTYKDFGIEFADYRDIAEFLESAMAEAKAAVAAGWRPPTITARPPGLPGNRRHAPWADRDAMLAIYKKCRAISKETGIKHHVDHIVPIKGRYVCGLHVENNLQIITGLENSRKNNKFEVT